MNYHEYLSHRMMLRDFPRTEAFRKSIFNIVKPGDIVLDVGAGTGILSMFAAKAGADRVYAVERTAISALGAHLSQLNGFDDRIQFLRGDVRTIQLPEKVDVIISEWMGTIGVDENMLGAVLWARDHLLREGGQVIPKKVTAHMAPITTAQRSDSGFFVNRPYDLDLSPLAEPSVHELLMIRRRIKPSDLAASSQNLWVSDVSIDAPSSVQHPYQSDVSYKINKAVKVSALGAWFTAELDLDVKLSNAPDAPDTHWGQLMLPLESELSLSQGDILQAKIVAKSVGPGPLHFSWSVRVNDGNWQHHDTLCHDSGAREATGGNFPAQEPLPANYSELTRFLAELAINPDLLHAFLTDPDKVMAKHKIPADQQAALKSQDAQSIQESLYQWSQLK